MGLTRRDENEHAGARDKDRNQFLSHNLLPSRFDVERLIVIARFRSFILRSTAWSGFFSFTIGVAYAMPMATHHAD